MSVLELVEVTKRYAKRTALSDVSLDLEEGSTLGLLGQNGAGKTTLLRLLLGFCRASRGQVRLRGGAGDGGFGRRRRAQELVRVLYSDPQTGRARRRCFPLPHRLCLQTTRHRNSKSFRFGLDKKSGIYNLKTDLWASSFAGQ